MGGQITHKPRNFVNRIDDIWVRSLYNNKSIVYLLEWDDRTKSVAEGKLPWGPTQVNIDIKEQEPKTGESGSIAEERGIRWYSLPALERAVYSRGRVRNSSREEPGRVSQSSIHVRRKFSKQ